MRFDDDLWRYLWDGAVTTSGVSPYRFAPQAVREHDPELDPLLYGEETARQLARLAARAAEPPVGEALERVNFPFLPTLYPPTSQLAFAAAAVLAPGQQRPWRALTAAADLLVVVLLLRLLAALGRPAWWAAAYALHALPALEYAAAGHQDPLGIALLLAAALALLGCRRGAAGALLALALPFLWLGPPDPAGLSTYLRQWEFFSGPYALLAGLTAALSHPGAGRTVLAAVLLLLAAADRFWRPRNPVDTLARGWRWLEVLLVLSPVVDPWYLPWGLAITTLRGSLAWPLLAALIPAAYLGYSFEGHSLGLRLVVWLPFLLLWWRELRRAGTA